MNSDPVSLTEAYRTRAITPSGAMERLLAGIAAADPAIWITPPNPELVLGRARELDSVNPEALPLYGLPFAIKDNIDLAGVPTTAGCPAFAYTPVRSAPVVERLVEAGAIPLGKTNMDQFATGLVGVRSPYGTLRNACDPAYIPGGSSSGSAVAVAEGLCVFALGSDTAGSGRIPAAFNGVVGLKPTRGLISTRGLVPACRTLDCVSVFARDVSIARAVLEVVAVYDPEDPMSRPAPAGRALPEHPVVGVPGPDGLEFFGGSEYPALWRAAAARLAGIAEVREIDFRPFREAADVLYGGPWLAERYAAVRKFLETHPEAMHPTTLTVIQGGKEPRAFEAFEAIHRLAALKREVERVFADGSIDFVATPTAGRIPTCAEVDAEPLRLNAELGYYTNFMNLLDLCAVAVPAGTGSPSGLPFGITLAGPAFADHAVAGFAERFLAAEDVD